MNNYRMLELSIEITHDCSISCNFCSSNARCVNRHSTNSEQPQRMLSFETIKNLLVEGKQCGARVFSLSGGEPLIYPNLWEVMDYAQSLNYKFLLYTSGSELNKDNEIIPMTHETVKRLLTYKNLEVIADVQNCEEKKVDKIMGVDGAFENAKTTISRCIEAGINVSTHFVPMSINTKDIVDTVDFLEGMGVSKVSMLRWVKQGRSMETPEKFELSKKEFMELQYTLLKLKEEEKDGGINIRIGIPLDFTFLISDKREPVVCRGGVRDPICIPNDDGISSSIHVCPSWKKLDRFKAGLFTKKGDLIEAWDNSKTFRIFRDFIYNGGYKLIKSDMCSTCTHFHQCRGGCVSQRLIYNSRPEQLLEDAILEGSDPMCFYDKI